MRLLKRLEIAGAEVPIVSEDIRLDIDRPGRAIFQVRADSELSGQVAFSLGWHFEASLTLFFTGEVERSTAVDAAQQRLFCREISARLDAQHPLSLRHPTLREVLAAYAQRTGLRFILPDRPYASTRVPAFYGLGSGYHGMASIGDVFGIEDYIWQAQGDGAVFVGSWADSRWPATPVSLPQEFFSRVTAGMQTITCVPGLRPGVVLNDRRVQSVRLAGHQMEVQCKTP